MGKIGVGEKIFLNVLQSPSLSKPVEFGLFTLQLAVVHTALYVHNAAIHRVYFELGLK